MEVEMMYTSPSLSEIKHIMIDIMILLLALLVWRIIVTSLMLTVSV